MTALRQAAKMALEALENLQGGCTDSDDGTVEAITVWCPEIIDALREALAQTEQEPTAWRVEDDAGVLCHFFDKELLNYYNKQPYRITQLYLHPAPIPEGWQLVPVEPTARMRNAFFQDYFPGPDIEVKIYKAMLDAAPKPEE